MILSNVQPDLYLLVQQQQTAPVLRSVCCGNFIIKAVRVCAVLWYGRSGKHSL